MTAVKNMGLSIPEDVMVTGFDGSPEASVVSPKLTTARINSTHIGRLAADLLLERIREPGRPFLYISEISPPVWGESTR